VTTPPASAGWRDRPAGMPAGVPPPSVPLSFLAAAAVGLIACGVSLVAVRASIVRDPTSDRVVGAAHLAMLATLSMAVLGALHQFLPVITQRALRSVRLSRATFLTWLAGAWLLPIGFISRRESVVEAGGALAAAAVTLLVLNVAPALAAHSTSAAVRGLRLGVIGFVATACYGVIYVIDRRSQWFDLSGHVVLAHAGVGLLAWLGLSYVSVAQKLWPMFMLSHVPGRQRSAALSVWSLFAGTAVLSAGLLARVALLAILGAGLVALGLGAHLFSLARTIRHRRRGADLHLAFVVASALWLVIGAALALAGALRMSGDHARGVALVASAVGAIAGWLLIALVGHSFKIVPFIAWSSLRARGVSRTSDGTQLMFADLFNRHWSAVDFALVNAGVASLVAGIAASSSSAVGLGGGLLAVTGVVTALDLAWRPLHMRHSSDATTGEAGPITLAAELRRR
jgi:hypothetical protein